MYICVLSSVPDDPNDPPYDPSPYMNGFKWKHHRVDPVEVEKQMCALRDRTCAAYGKSWVGLYRRRFEVLRPITSGDEGLFKESQRPYTKLGNG